MTPYRRNIVVGITMLGALAVLGWMILQFGDRPARFFAPPTMHVTFEADRANGVADGSIIGYRGVAVGRVAKINLDPDRIHVKIDAELYTSTPLPENVVGMINSQLFGGSATLSMQLSGDQPQGQLKAGAVLSARFAGPAILPPEFADLATELRLTSRQFRETQLVPHLDAQVEKVGRILDSVDKLVGDPKMREDIRGAIANIRTAAETANRVGAKLDTAMGQVNQTLTDTRTTLAKTNTSIDTLSRQMNDRLEQVGRTLSNLESITGKIDQGHGTAGALVNDPKLYQSLVDTAKELNATIADLKRLVEQWEQEGVHLKLH